MITNLTPHATDLFVGKDPQGEMTAVCAVKASFTWDDQGRLSPGDPTCILQADEAEGDGIGMALLRSAERGLPKPKVDVLFAGSFVFQKAITSIELGFSIGQRLRKRARVFGDRTWITGLSGELVPSTIRPVMQVPISWTRSFGGADPVDPTVFDKNNPAGSGVAKSVSNLAGKIAPNFEAPSALISTWKSRPVPVGFGPLAPHWPARIAFAGTYDQTWKQTRYPLPPVDFNPRFFNAAPTDQQLPDYPPGENLRLLNMSTPADVNLVLPDLSIPVLFVTTEGIVDTTTLVDTIVVEPLDRRLSLVGKAQVPSLPTALALRNVFVGALTPDQREKIELGLPLTESA